MLEPSTPHPLPQRETGEWEAGRIPGLSFMPYHDPAGIPDGLHPSRPIAVFCSSGQRSALAASVLKRHGAEHVIHVAEGGVGTWQAQGWPIEMPEPARGRG